MWMGERRRRGAMASPVTLDLDEVAWMRRELPDAAGCVLLGRTRVYAGDHDGRVVYSKTSFAANRTYYDTLDLAPGCYEVILYDSGDDGSDG